MTEDGGEYEVGVAFYYPLVRLWFVVEEDYVTLL